MKKRLLFLLMIAGLNTGVFSITETWLSLGFGYGNFFENVSGGGSYARTYRGSPGINLNVYNFWNNKNVGLFVHDFFGFPKKSTIEINGVKEDVDLSVYDFIMQIGMVIGPGFRYNLNERLKLHFGIGLSLMETTASYSRYVHNYGTIDFGMLALNFGVGGDIDIKCDINDIFYLNVGNMLVYDFVSYVFVSPSIGGSSGRATDYYMIGVRPYICVGFNRYKGKEGNRFGKP